MHNRYIYNTFTYAIHRLIAIAKNKQTHITSQITFELAFVSSTEWYSSQLLFSWYKPVSEKHVQRLKLVSNYYLKEQLIICLTGIFKCSKHFRLILLDVLEKVEALP